MDFKQGIYQRIAAGEWLIYHFTKDLHIKWNEGIWDKINFFSFKHATRITELIVSLGVRPLPPHLWYLYSPAPPKRWYESLADESIAFEELYEVVIGFSELYGKLIKRYGFEEEFLKQHFQDWEYTKRRMRNIMGR